MIRFLPPAWLAVLTAAVPCFAQPVDGNVWVSFNFAFGSPCGLCVYDAAGVVVASFVYPGIDGPMLCKHPNGTVWTVSSSAAGSLIPYTVAGAGIPIAASGVNQICADAFGGLWTFEGGFFSPSVLRRRTAAGAPVLTVTPANFLGAADMAGDPLGNVWLLDAASTGGLRRVNQSGTVSAPIGAAAATGAGLDLAVEPSGRVWRLSQGSGGTPLLTRFNNAGTGPLPIPVPGALSLAMDRCGRPVVLKDTGGVTSLDVLNPANGAVIVNIPLPGPGIYDSLAIDGAGNHWLTSNTQLIFSVFDAAGAPLVSVPVALPMFSFSIGDRTGLHVATVLAPGADSDLDGVASNVEIPLGTNPLDPASVPPALLLSGTPAAGSSFALGLSIPAQAGFPFVTGASLGSAGIPLAPPDCRVIPLSADFLLAWWLGPSNVVATSPVSGVLDALGAGSGSVGLPPGPGFGGLPLFFAAATLNPLTGTVASLTPALPVVLP